MMKILNFGSCNIDMVYSVDHIVCSGETIHTKKLDFFAGGKGLNQSIAASRAGAEVYHAGCLGYDGQMLEDILVSSGVDVAYLKKVNEKNGHAVIQVDKNGENCIFLFSGSNKMIEKKDIDFVLSRFEKNDILLLQNEINNIEYIINQGYKRGMQIVLNPSPFDDNMKNIDLSLISFLILNETEAKGFSGKDTPEAFFDFIKTNYPKLKTVLTLGKRGCTYYDCNQRIFHPSFTVPVVDTTAAGDTFTGYFISAVAEGSSVYQALKTASCASALAVSKSGAAPSIPLKKDVDDALLKLKPHNREKEKRQNMIKAKLDSFLDANLSNPTLSSFSKLLGYSESHTGALIKKITGVSFSEYLQKKRCEKAAVLLASSDIPIMNIIHTVGYENESFFRKKFKELYGLPPLKYRKSYKEFK